MCHDNRRTNIRRGSRIQKGGFVQEFRFENRSYPDIHDFSLRMQVIIANANNIAHSRGGGGGGGGSEHPKKTPVSAPEYYGISISLLINAVTRFNGGAWLGACEYSINGIYVVIINMRTDIPPYYSRGRPPYTEATPRLSPGIMAVFWCQEPGCRVSKHQHKFAESRSSVCRLQLGTK